VNNAVGAVSCHLSSTHPNEMINEAMSLGLDAIEWFEGEETSLTEPESAREITRMCRKHGLASSYHAPFLGRWDLGRMPGTEAISCLYEMLERAARIKAQLMTLHLGSHHLGEDKAIALARVTDIIAKSAPRAEQLGVHITVENFTFCYGDTALGTTVAEFVYLLEHTPPEQVGWNLDVGHANITCNLADLIASCGPRLRNMHLHDTDGITDGHWPPGAGTIDWRALRGYLERVNYAGPYNLEFPVSSGAYPNVIAWLRQ